MDADTRESDTLDEEIVDFGIHEDVVDEQLAHVHVRNRGRVVTGGIINGRVSNVLENLVGVSKSNVNKSLTVRDGHGRDGQTRILVKPEQEGHPQVKLRLNGLRGLRTGVDLNLLAHTSTTSKTRVHETIIRDLLSHVALPADTLIRRDEELLVHVVHIRVVLIKRVSVHGELNILDKGLSEVVDVTEVTVRVVGVISGDSAELKMENHIMEEISKLRNRELNVVSKSSRSGLNTNLVILVADSGEGLEMGVHK
jgi:hypothetical protein